MCKREGAIRKLEAKDAERMVEMMHDEQTVKYLQVGGKNYTREQAEAFIAYAQNPEKDYHFAVIDVGDIFQGTISLKNVDYTEGEAEYAIAMHPEAQGKGIAAKATKCILEYAFETLGLKRVYLNVLKENVRANKFYEKMGFHFSGMSVCCIRGENMPLNWYEITR